MNIFTFRWHYRAIQVLCGIVILSTLSTQNIFADDIPTSIDYTMYKLATEMNDSAAQYFIGKKYYLGTEITGDKKEAAKWFRLASKKEYTKAQYMLGKMLMYGEGISKNYKQARELLSKAAKKHHTEAQYELANMFFNGYGGAKDSKSAITWYKRAAEDRHARAQLQLGKILYSGLGVTPNRSAGTKWLKLAQENGVTEARNVLENSGETDSETTEIAKAPPKAKPKEPEQPKELTLAENGNVDAQYTLGIRYLKGDGSRKNPQKAVKWIRKAAEQDHAGAQYQLGIMYRDGIGVPKSENEAVKWLRLASSWGINKAQRDLDSLLRKQLLASEDEFTANPELSNPDSQFALGMMYVDGKGVAKDPSTAVQWFLKAANQDHHEAQYRLGKMYIDGEGVKSSKKEAKLWLAKAADGGLTKASKALEKILKSEEERILKKEVQALQSSILFPYLEDAKKGDVDAKYQVGILYVEGKHVPKDVNEGIRWLQDAAKSDHAMAQLKLGEIYLNGLPQVDKDYVIAVNWLQKAADTGNPDAQYNLGNMYKKGLGVDKSNAKAVKWFRLAAKQGHVKARKQLGGCKIC